MISALWWKVCLHKAITLRPWILKNDVIWVTSLLWLLAIFVCLGDDKGRAHFAKKYCSLLNIYVKNLVSLKPFCLQYHFISPYYYQIVTTIHKWHLLKFNCIFLGRRYVFLLKHHGRRQIIHSIFQTSMGFESLLGWDFFSIQVAELIVSPCLYSLAFFGGFLWDSVMEKYLR